MRMCNLHETNRCLCVLCESIQHNENHENTTQVSQRMTAMIGWGATTKFQEQWVFDQSAATYALDKEMAEKLMDANPEAFKNIVGRLLEATNRGMWEPDADTLAKLQDLYQVRR